MLNGFAIVVVCFSDCRHIAFPKSLFRPTLLNGKTSQEGALPLFDFNTMFNLLLKPRTLEKQDGQTEPKETQSLRPSRHTLK